MIKKILIILLLCPTAFGQWSYQQKPMLGQQIDWNNPLTKGLVGCWLMNEGAGNIVQDLSGNGNTGTFMGTVAWTAGNHGSAISLDGTNSYVTCGNPTSQVTSEFTAIVCSYRSSTASNRRLFCWGDYNAADSPFGMVCNGNDENVDISVAQQYKSNVAGLSPLNDWGVIAISCRSGTPYKIYFNGKYIDEHSQPAANAPTAAHNITIGSGIDGAAAEFIGYISYAMIYNRALSAIEIAELYRNPFCFIQEAFPVWWYGGIGGVPSVGQVIYIN